MRLSTFSVGPEQEFFHFGLASGLVSKDLYYDVNHYSTINWTLSHVQNSSSISSAAYFDREDEDLLGGSAIDLTAGEIISKLSMQVMILS